MAKNSLILGSLMGEGICRRPIVAIRNAKDACYNINTFNIMHCTVHNLLPPFLPFPDGTFGATEGSGMHRHTGAAPVQCRESCTPPQPQS